jgi:hypothetical protein
VRLLLGLKTQLGTQVAAWCGREVRLNSATDRRSKITLVLEQRGMVEVLCAGSATTVSTTKVLWALMSNAGAR